MKKSLSVFTIMIMLFSAVACNIHAQFARQGVIEFGGSVAYSSSTIVTDGTASSNTTSLLNFMPYVNYFIVNGFSVALSPGVNILKYTGYSAITNLDLFVVPGYTFSVNNNFFPYIEALLGYTSLSSDPISLEGISEKLDNSGFSWGGKAGIKLPVGKSGLFSVGVAYTALNFSAKGADKRSGLNNIAFDMGFSVFIGK